MNNRMIYFVIIVIVTIIVGAILFALFSENNDNDKIDGDGDPGTELIFETDFKVSDGFTITLSNYSKDFSLNDFYIFIQTDYITNLYAEQLTESNMSLFSLKNGYEKDYMIYELDNGTIINSINVTTHVKFKDSDNDDTYSEGDEITIENFNSFGETFHVKVFHIYYIEENIRSIYHDVIGTEENKPDNPYHVND